MAKRVNRREKTGNFSSLTSSHNSNTHPKSMLFPLPLSHAMLLTHGQEWHFLSLLSPTFLFIFLSTSHLSHQNNVEGPLPISQSMGMMPVELYLTSSQEMGLKPLISIPTLTLGARAQSGCGFWSGFVFSHHPY